MPFLTCTICNDVPFHPVISPVSGRVFEKRLIEKYINEYGTDPVTGQELTVDQLIEIRTPAVVRPKPPSATSVPALLKIKQDEWDALLVHSFTLRQQLQTARQELSHLLYQHDSACRVISRLTKELTAAREALATLKPQASIAAQPAMPHPSITAEASGVAQEEQTGITNHVIEQLQAKASVLTQKRKSRGRSVPENLMPADNIRQFETLATHSGLHSDAMPGILALDICPSNTNKILTGGADNNATVFLKDSEQIVTVLKGHTNKVTQVIYHPSEEVVMTGSPDETIRVWNVGTSQTSLLMRHHDGPITGLSLHPTGDYLLSSSLDHCWAFSDITTGRLLTKVSGHSSHPLTSAQFHPDGLIFGIGTADSQIKIWDLKEQTNVANFPGHTGSITAISFSENGYYLATAADDSCVKLWDLRKLKNFKTLQLDDSYKVQDLCFDQSGTYLAVAGSDVRIYQCKLWNELKVSTEHSDLATGVRFGENAQYVASTSKDQTLKIYGQPQ